MSSDPPRDPDEPSIAPPPPLENPDPGATLYREIEDVVTAAQPDDVPQVFAELKERLEKLKGNRALQGKKVSTALERTEDLFRHLIQVRERMKEK